MPRPILKSLSSYASPLRFSNSSSKRKGKQVSSRRHVGSSRHVTFSPFTKLRQDSSNRSQLADVKEIKDSLTSGFTFSSATEAEKNKHSRRKEELQTMQALYRASMRRPHSMKSLLLAYVPGLKRLNKLASYWMDYAKTARNMVSWSRSSRPKRQKKRRLRKLLQGRWTDLREADYKYVQQLALSSKMTHSTLLLPSSTSSMYINSKLLAIFRRSPQPDLTPASRGGFTSLLREKGISVDEDEREANLAISEDLRGLSRPIQRRRIQW
ncbi:unnamed protein product [Peronospora belbahrii]|uniref:Uncharacterized protein n=1 Tax=Peronospora belbahrii TaxID=622444 RepID=A0AAU9L6K6_9STRA|nr:unnamed protein product [Peronospora belbahrii]CAH0516450.1 unnamed protein product [Peronospora belbahrii]